MSNCLLKKWYIKLLNNNVITSNFGVKFLQNRLFIFPHRKNIFDFNMLDISYSKIGFEEGLYGQPKVIVKKENDEREYRFDSYNNVEKHLEKISSKAPIIDYGDTKTYF